MALDNPNYFTVAANSPAKFSLFRRRAKTSSDSSIQNLTLNLSSSLKISSPPTSPRFNTTRSSCTTPERKNVSNDRHHRRSFRSLLRSVSSNGSAHALIGGEPRPSDVAPDSPVRKINNERKSSLQSPSDDDVFLSDVDTHHAQSTYYNLRTSTLPSSTSGGQVGRRRHSIGTFVKDRSNKSPIVTNVVDDVPKMPAPRVPPSLRRIHNRSAREIPSLNSLKKIQPTLYKPPKQREKGVRVMDDVVLISSRHSEAAAQWVDYLTTCFDQITRQKGQQPLRILPLRLEDLPSSLSPELARRVEGARLLVPIICPGFLEVVTQTPSPSTAMRSITALCRADRVVAMLLGVVEQSVTDEHKSVLLSYSLWKRMAVRDQDQSFVSDLLGAAMDILNRQAEPTSGVTGKPTFSVLPKKVKPGQSRVLVLLNEPVQPQDVVNITVERSGEIIRIEQVKRKNPYTLQINIPDSCMDVSMLVNIRVEKNNVVLGTRPVKCESRLRELDQILRSQDHPIEFICQTLGFTTMDRDQLDSWMVTSFQKNLPPNFHLLAGTHPPVNGPRHNIPEEYPTLLHFAARFGLDRLCWQLLECPGGELACEARNAHGHCPADLAHASGHDKLAGMLRGYMQMNELSSMYTYLKGISGESATLETLKISDNKTLQPEHTRPRSTSETYSVVQSTKPASPEVSGYLEMSPTKTDELSMQCSQVLELANDLMNDSETEGNSEHSSQSDSFINRSLDKSIGIDEYIPTNMNTGDYLTHPSNIKVNEFNTQKYNDYLTHPSNIPVNNFSDYLTHPSNIKVALAEIPNVNKFHRQLSLNETSSSVEHHRHFDQKSKSHNNLHQSKMSVKSREQLNTEDELLEIINDFKNNVFTISEVEQLVANWRTRNDVQQSFKDKQDQLAKMRQEYERIQQSMKESLKRPTPFDRVKKFFSRGKSKAPENKDTVSAATIAGTAEEIKTSNIRPRSSLSLQSVSSSSSSGRMSTGSACSGASLGDSGTHSDNEDRKFLLGHIQSDGFVRGRSQRATGFENYLIPPNPRPVNLNLNLSGDFEFKRNNERSTNSFLRGQEDSQYYIHFPPSGLPVNGGVSRMSPQTPQSPLECLAAGEYMNVNPSSSTPCGLKTIQELDGRIAEEESTEVDEQNGRMHEYINVSIN